MTCKDCYKADACYWGLGDYLSGVEEICRTFKDKNEVVEVTRCEECTIKKAVPHKDGIVWRCPHRTGDVKMEGYCEYGKRGM